MSSKSKIRELEGMNNGTSSISKWGDESKNSLYRSKSHLALDDDVYDVPHLDPHLRQDQTSTGTRGIQQGQWELEGMGDESKHCLYSWRSHVALDGDVYYVQYLNPHLRQDQTSTGTRGIQQGQWELEGMNNGTNSISKWGDESKHCLYSWRSHVALDGDVPVPVII
ncbi:hypothetical protein TSUD_191810 [Trifolium subterraneum]|uniref:Uncharacterized protein n=1 Tax=Trifolium subterraneum TaxID=3900 RepID=A0A2Z6PHD5_TRISU|nr:hypothetical protein TSUD_191810 [Trifolium subterraneum]